MAASYFAASAKPAPRAHRGLFQRVELRWWLEFQERGGPSEERPLFEPRSGEWVATVDGFPRAPQPSHIDLHLAPSSAFP